MYPKFIELRDADQGCMLSLNVANICGFNEYCEDQKKTVIAMNDCVYHVVDQTYDEVKQMITESGCLIRKQDPRLDDEPLTMKELKGMVGEPVWNSNSRKWELVWYSDEKVYTRDCGAEYEYTEDDLIKYPLYRMKVTE